MFLVGKKLRPYIPMSKASGFTGTVDKKRAPILALFLFCG
jgi:hypothetical protein